LDRDRIQSSQQVHTIGSSGGDGTKLITAGGTIARKGEHRVQIWGIRLRDRLLGPLGL
jgi:hypothetical protein